MEKTVAILCGLQGSGKSTFYQNFLADTYVRVNLDTLKTRHRERELIEACFSEGRSFAVDNTNPTKEDRKRYLLPAKEQGYRVVGYYLESKLKICIERNALREGKARVPDTAIAATSCKLEIPSYEEGFDELYYVKNDGKTMTVLPWR
ncbi:MAG: ATP-binding protein [Clostridia bacterium]|nr:ATP-binding protein [Clostridia bacterium]